MLEWLKEIFHAKEIQDPHTFYLDPPISFADHFPEIPPPDGDLAPQMLAARWASRDLWGSEMPQIAANLLAAGYDSPALHRLAEEPNIAQSGNLEELVTQLFHELSAEYPLTEDEINRIFIRQIAREVIAGKKNPWAAANHVAAMLRGHLANDPDIVLITGLLDPMIWEDLGYEELPAMTQELVEAFARLAAKTDREKQPASVS